MVEVTGNDANLSVRLGGFCVVAEWDPALPLSLHRTAALQAGQRLHTPNVLTF
jgi:hypothetical protein